MTKTNKNLNFAIGGTQRSGTTLLRLILNQHSNICVPEESTFLLPFLNKKHLNKHINDTDKIIKYLNNNSQFKKWGLNSRIIDEDLVERKMLTYKEFILSLYSLYSSQMNSKLLGDKTPSFFRKIKHLKSLNPNIKFIFIVRDCRDVYLSLKNKNHHSIKNIELFSFEWQYKIKVIMNDINSLDKSNFLIVKYEDLIVKPES